MKVKQRRDDFVVREISSFRVGGGGFATYTLEKSGIGTGEAIEATIREWNVSQKDVAYGGRKDRHAVTSQTVTIWNGPQSNLEHEKFSLTYLGQSGKAFEAQDIRANEFEIQLRHLPPETAQRMVDLASKANLCIPNYFDQQRFGSVGNSGEFVALPWCLKDYERAVFLALADENHNDPPGEREQRAILRDHWGDWQACKDRLDRGNRRSVITYLVDHPAGFKKAAALINREMRSLYVSAFQSRIWNDLLARWLQQTCDPSDLVPLPSVGCTLQFPKHSDATVVETLQQLQIPLPSGRKSDWPSNTRQLVSQILKEQGLELHQLRFSHPRDVFFARGLRNAILSLGELSAANEPDELSDSDKSKVILKFRLAPGQYATMLIKALELLGEAG